MDYGCVKVDENGFTVQETRFYTAYRMSTDTFLARSLPEDTGQTIHRNTITQRLGSNWPEYISGITDESSMVKKRKLALEQLQGDVSDRCFRFNLNT